MAEKPIDLLIRLINAWGDECGCERVSVSLQFVSAEMIFRFGSVVSHITRLLSCFPAGRTSLSLFISL